jgi:hypothetical protein
LVCAEAAVRAPPAWYTSSSEEIPAFERFCAIVSDSSVALRMASEAATWESRERNAK